MMSTISFSGNVGREVQTHASFLSGSRPIAPASTAPPPHMFRPKAADSLPSRSPNPDARARRRSSERRITGGSRPPERLESLRSPSASAGPSIRESLRVGNNFMLTSRKEILVYGRQDVGGQPVELHADPGAHRRIPRPCRFWGRHMAPPAGIR